MHTRAHVTRMCVKSVCKCVCVCCVCARVFVRESVCGCGLSSVCTCTEDGCHNKREQRERAAQGKGRGQIPGARAVPTAKACGTRQGALIIGKSLQGACSRSAWRVEEEEEKEEGEEEAEEANSRCAEVGSPRLKATLWAA